MARSRYSAGGLSPQPVTRRPLAWRGVSPDITAIKRLSDMGFEFTVTGRLALEDLPLFKGIPIHVFIAGRSIRDAASPVKAARQFKRSIAELWAERICCPNKFRLASMKKRSPPGSAG